MKKMTKMTIALALLLLFLTAGISLAMRHSGHSGHGSSAPAASGHDAHQMKKTSEAGHSGGHMGMEMTDDMIMLGTQARDGVKAMAHISDTREAMAAAGMKQTHHLMVAFEDAATMKALDSGRVAVRIVAPGGQTLPAISLSGMDGAFGGDVELREKGTYTLQVGTQLQDNKARQFEFQYEVK
ncbi:hypothetical protein [Pelovirga terrestris]|uniref:YtkA-like domain-containing protein n=1 Tax=Pelovirga terrestris TaxID=2771352 RepID=A0A8J6QXS9_9BACT|nr:hypothetical protein [Pelovirga terrestris]MBD1400497.1 hypothetical protein [Pelovirga terrestris]